MKISIITPTYNSERTIVNTLESVISQSHSDVEYIIIDGGSSDGTLDILDKYKNKITKIISEPDNGIYYAMNKGVALASGDIVAIINSDDFYSDKNVLSKVNSIFESRLDISAVYGDLVYVDKTNIKKETRYWKSGEYSENKLNNGWVIPHPTFFLRNSVYKSLDKIFDTKLSLAADYELMLRLLKIKKIKVFYIPEILVKMRAGGSSAKNLENRFLGWKELNLSWKINNLKTPKFFIVRRILNKIKQFL